MTDRSAALALGLAYVEARLRKPNPPSVNLDALGNPVWAELHTFENKLADQERREGQSHPDRPLAHSGEKRAGFVVLNGGASCEQTTRKGRASKSQSNARSFMAMHDCAVQPLAEPARESGLLKQPKNWPHEWDAPFARQLMKSQEIESHLRVLLASLWPKSPNGLCGND